MQRRKARSRPGRRIGLDELTREPLPGLDHPTRLAFTLGGEAVTYLQPDPGTNLGALWRLDLETGQRSRLAGVDAEGGEEPITLEEELSRQRRREAGGGITDYRRAEDADVVAALLNGRCLVSRDGSPAVGVAGIEDAEAALPDPGGRRLAWVRDGDLHLADLETGDSARLTDDSAPGVANGLADYLAAEELDRFEGAWWSVAGDALAFAHVDEREIRPFAISRPRSGAGAEEHRYPFAGGPNPRTTIRIVAPLPTGSAHEAHIDFGDGYLARVVPHPLGGWLVAALPRDQRSLHWYRLEASGDATELWVERAEPWVNLDEATRVLRDGRIIRATEETGFRHLELRDVDGSPLRKLTAGDWVVSDLVHVDETRGEALFIGTCDGVLERHLYAVGLDAAQPVTWPKRLTQEPGWHSVTVSSSGDRWIDSWSTRDEPTRIVVRSRLNATTVTLHEPTASAREASLIVPELTTVPAADGATQIHVALFRPPGSGGESAPAAVVFVYGGPHSQNVQESWTLTVQPYRQALARAGFSVVVADNRGTANRGVAFEAPLAGALGGVEVDDQAAVVEALAERGEVDPRRVGITGWSYGGFMTVMAMLRRPDLFRAGVAGAPVVDWDGYDTAYTERYLGRPTSNPGAYAASSLLPRVTALRGSLLLVHGALDENVHLRHTTRLRKAMRAAGRDGSLLVLSGERHSVRRPVAQRRWLRRAIGHFCEALGLPLPDDLPSRRTAGKRAQAAS